jgi:hypothetical protein
MFADRRAERWPRRPAAAAAAVAASATSAVQNFPSSGPSSAASAAIEDSSLHKPKKNPFNCFYFSKPTLTIFIFFLTRNYFIYSSN